MSRASCLGILIIVVALQCLLKKLLNRLEQLFSKFLVPSQKTLECHMYQSMDFLKALHGAGTLHLLYTLETEFEKLLASNNPFKWQTI